MIIEKLNPEYRFSSILNITPDWMRSEGYEALLLDVDNTLLPRNSAAVPAEHIDWLRHVRQQGIAVVLSSNNGGARARQIEEQLQANALDVPLLTWAAKPVPRAYSKAFRLLEEQEDALTAERPVRILAAGDQLFTDVLGAHLSGIPAAWLRPLSQNDFIGTKVLRLLEKQISRYLDKKALLPEENGKSKESRDGT